MPDVTLQIDGMSCGHCLQTVQRALAALPGATIRTVQMGRAVVATTPDGPSAEELAAVVSAAGYPATAVGVT